MTNTLTNTVRLVRFSRDFVPAPVLSQLPSRANALPSPSRDFGGNSSATLNSHSSLMIVFYIPAVLIRLFLATNRFCRRGHSVVMNRLPETHARAQALA